MNRAYYWILPLLLCAGCQGGVETSYVIDGHVNNAEANGNIIYLSHSNGDELVNLDSAIVDDGLFSFRGEQEVPIMAYLRFNRSLDSLAVPVLFVLDRLLPLYGCMWVQPIVDSISLVVALSFYRRVKLQLAEQKDTAQG